MRPVCTVLLHLHCLLFGVLGWVSVQHFEISADVRRAIEIHLFWFMCSRSPPPPLLIKILGKPQLHRVYMCIATHKPLRSRSLWPCRVCWAVCWRCLRVVPPSCSYTEAAPPDAPSPQRHCLLHRHADMTFPHRCHKVLLTVADNQCYSLRTKLWL